MDIRKFLFRHRSYTPIPLFTSFIIFAKPSRLSLTGGLVVALAGEGLRLWGVYHAGGATRTTCGVGGDALITCGPFAYVRNPLYLGNFLLLCGLCVMSWAWMPWMFTLVVALFTLQYSLIISLEEEHLRKKFGQEYEHYFAYVPRFLPRRTPFRPSFASRGSGSVPLPYFFKGAERGERGKRLLATLKTERSTLLMLCIMTSAIFLGWIL